MNFGFRRGPQSRKARENQATLDAVSRSLAVIEFAPDGTILTANGNFLSLMGYTLSDIVGQHHRIFMAPEDVTGPGYDVFWASLARGEFQQAEYRRLTKGGDEVWIQASYNPVLNEDGKPFKVIKIASDVTERKLSSTDSAGQIAAISRSQAVIEFTPNGEVLAANENFCRALGYELSEIVGKHHRMFVMPHEAAQPEYQAFWQRLRQGQFEAAEYLRVGNNGRQVWIQATYNPIFDPKGQVYKIVKYATDVTERRRAVDVLSDGLKRLAEGDLRSRIDETLGDEFEPVRQAYNYTLERFSQIVLSLQNSAGSLRAATNEILSGSNDLAERTAQQASAIEQTSANMQKLLLTVQDNARRAVEASTKAQAITTATADSGTVMERARDAMASILASSARIANIVGVIDDIAFQTNLLALNASVEAARAGESGKGFAVVAVEVRRLAQSAAKASAEVKGLIEGAAAEVAVGSKLIDQTSVQLASLVSDVRDNGTLMDSIARVSSEQARGISEVADAISQMDMMTQHNAALVEQTNSAIEQTEMQAGELDSIVDTFAVDVAAERKPALSDKALDRPLSGVAAALSGREPANMIRLAERRMRLPPKQLEVSAPHPSASSWAILARQSARMATLCFDCAEHFI